MATPIANAVRTIRELTARAEAAEKRIADDQGSNLMTCTHPRGCVVTAPYIKGVASSNECGWCASIAKAEAEEERYRIERKGHTALLREHFHMKQQLVETQEQLRSVIGKLTQAQTQVGRYRKEALGYYNQLAEARERLDSAGVVGIYDEFASIPDAVYQMARHIKDLERQLAEQAGRIIELERLVPDADVLDKLDEMLAFTDKNYSINVPETEIGQYFRRPRAILAAIRKYGEAQDGNT